MHFVKTICNLQKLPTMISLYAEAMQECLPLWSEIIERTYKWQRDEQLASAVRAVTLPQLIAFFRAHFAANAPQRRKLVSHASSHAEAMPQADV